MSLAGSKVEVLRQQQPRLNFDLPTNRDNSVDVNDTVLGHVPPTKSAFRLHNRFVLLLTDKINYPMDHTFWRPDISTSLYRSHCDLAPGSSAGTSHDPEQSLTDYIHHLEKVQQRLMGARQGKQSNMEKIRKGRFLTETFDLKQKIH